MLSIGLLGAGRIGQIHARNVALNPRARLAGVADPDGDAARRASQDKAPILGIEEILADSAIAAVIIATPTDTHADLVERAAAAGKAIFCEKPIDLDIGRVRECLAAVARHKAKLFVGFNRRFDPHFRALKERLPVIGRLEMLSIVSRDPGPPPLSYIARSGGLFRDMMIHDLDMARWLLGEEPVELTAMASNLVDPAIGSAGDVDSAMVTLRTRSGALCHISNSRRASYGYDQRIEVHGSQGMLRAGNPIPTTIEQADSAGYRHDPLMNFFLDRYSDAYRNELDAFIDALLGNGAMAPDGEDGLHALLLADAAARSAQEGRPVRL